jgi:hypothetical protein
VELAGNPPSVDQKQPLKYLGGNAR